MFVSVTPLFLFLLLGGVVLGANELRIHNASDFITFSNNVNKGTSYSGTTIYLDSDIVFDSSLSQQFKPIGYSSTKYFNGTFNGKGHIISGLALKLSLQCVGLFGYSKGVIENVVMDESCSVVRYYNSNSADIGSIVGYCESCVIESIVNMASVTLAKNTIGNTFYLGGIVGRFIGSSTIRNCVNYGPVTYSGNSTEDANIGGIAGMYGGDGDKYIQNCANYGTITHKEESKNLYMGGIVGNNWYGTTSIENCVSSGRIMNLKQASENNYIGSVIGGTSSTHDPIANITHCLWTSDVGNYTAYDPRSTGTVTVTNFSLRELNDETTNELNKYNEKNSTWNKWFMLHLNGGKINNLNQETLIVTQKHFPDPVKGGYTFLFWCKNTKCTERYDPNATDITGITDLYAQYQGNNYEVSFDFGNGTKTAKIVTYGKSYGTLPSAGERTGHTFAGWFTEEEEGQGERITEGTTVSTASDHTLYAQWTINKYTITFIFNNGTENEVRTFQFNETIVYPENPTREGYTFNGWSPKLVRMLAENVTVTAQWTEKPSERSSSSGPEKSSEFVEIVFSKKDLNEEEIREIIREYTDSEFSIEKFEDDEETGGTKVIVKFVDKVAAKSFVEVVRASSDTKQNYISKIGFVKETPGSLSSSLFVPIVLLGVFV